MSIDHLQDLHKLFPRHRRVRLAPQSDESRRKVPAGVMDGIICGVVPIPNLTTPPDPDAPTGERFGIEIEIKIGEVTRTVILDPIDIELHETT